MTAEVLTKPLTSKNKMRQEYSVILDGVVGLPATAAEKPFFDGLLDTVIEYVEKSHGLAAISMTHNLYKPEADNEIDGSEVKRGGRNSKNGQRVRPFSQKVRQSGKRARG